MQYLRTIDPKELKGKRVILRADFNVPMQDGEILGDTRILKTLPTIEFLREAGAKLVIIAHIGGENGKTLAPVATYLSRYTDIVFAPDFKSVETRNVADNLREGEAILFENLRNDPGEKKNDPAFAAFLAEFGDIYVNDAFSVSHRAHASVVGIPKLRPSYAGLLFEEELKQIQAALHPEHPFLFILGGAKFDTKLPLLKKFMGIADTIFVGGALAHNILRVRGFEIGTSLVSEGDFDLDSLVKNEKVLVPSEVVVRTGEEVLVKDMGSVGKEDKIVDAGRGTIEILAAKVKEAKFILWNGPLGNYEEGFSEGTNELARIIAESHVPALVGGGDTLTAVGKMGTEESNMQVSTAGGAMLDYLANETLPGIEALS